MSKNTNDWHLNEEAELSGSEKKSLLQKYLYNPLSIASSKLASVIKTTIAFHTVEPLEERPLTHKTQDIHEQCLYTRFTDRVDPSIYYSIFFDHLKF